MLRYNGVNIFSSNYIQKGLFSQCRGGIIMHPYSMGEFILNETKGNYVDVFVCIGINEHTIDACVDFAKQRLIKHINNF